MSGPFEHSKSRIDRAGALLSSGAVEDAEARDVIERFRLAHAVPMTRVAQRLMSDLEIAPAEVTSRLKRYVQILGKLRAHPSMKLSRMQDVGGCRITASAEQIEVAEAWINTEVEVVGVSDYRATPRATGYRALHLVVMQDECRIEIQLRTPAQNRWAAWVEDVARDRGIPELKDGRGPRLLVENMARVADEIDAGTMDLARFALMDLWVRNFDG